MAIELTASRLMAPYFGTSIFVWGNVIGVVMITLAVGYWWGGKLADKKPKISVLAFLVFICGVFLSFLPLFFKPLVGVIVNYLNSPSLLLFALLCFWVVLFILAFPLIILGMSSPFIIRITNEKIDTTGKTAGSVFAWGTVGSILGVFSATFVTVPFLGSMETVLLCAIALILLAGFSLPGKYKFLIVLVLIPLLIYFAPRRKNVSESDYLLFENETPYQYVKVIDYDGWRYLKFNEGHAVQSYINFDQPHFLTGESYYDYFNFLPYLNHGENAKKNFLMIGGGGGTAAKQLVSFWRPKIKIDYVEIDKTVIDIAQKFFKMNEPEIKVHNRDGRFFLSKAKKQYDYVIVDAYSNQLFIPFHVTTDEFFRLTGKKLKKDGVLSMNVNADSFDSELLQRILSTVKNNFEYVRVLPLKNSYNFLIFASNEGLDFDFAGAEIEPDLRFYLPDFQNLKKFEKFQPEDLLTDNRAPIEFLTDSMILKIFVSHFLNNDTI